MIKTTAAEVNKVMQLSNAVIRWDVCLSRPVQDWELELLVSFMELIYNSPVRGAGFDNLFWKSARNRGFGVPGYYHAQLLSNDMVFPWKAVWCSKVPPTVAFFTCTAALRKILAIDNLRKMDIFVFDWRCTCKRSGESVDHLLLHSPIAYAVDDGCCLFGLK